MDKLFDHCRFNASKKCSYRNERLFREYRDYLNVIRSNVPVFFPVTMGIELNRMVNKKYCSRCGRFESHACK